MSNANPTMLGKKMPKKGAMIHGAGDHYKFVRCPECKAKYMNESKCPECGGKGNVQK